jgi:hypothetical protein
MSFSVADRPSRLPDRTLFGRSPRTDQVAFASWKSTYRFHVRLSAQDPLLRDNPERGGVLILDKRMHIPGRISG